MKKKSINKIENDKEIETTTLVKPSHLLSSIHDILIQENLSGILFGSALWSYYNWDYAVKDLDVLVPHISWSQWLKTINFVDQFYLISKLQPIYSREKYLNIGCNAYTYTMFKVDLTSDILLEPWLLIPPKRFYLYLLGIIGEYIDLETKHNKDNFNFIMTQYIELKKNKEKLCHGDLLDVIKPYTITEFEDIFYGYDLSEIRMKYSEQLWKIIL